MLIVVDNRRGTLKPMKSAIQTPSVYPELLQELKNRIRHSQVRPSLAVTRELVLLYWLIGRDILIRRGSEGWGSGVIGRRAHDLQSEFPGIEGFSLRSLKYMRSFAEAWPEEPIVLQVAGLLPRGHHMLLLDRAKEPCHSHLVPSRPRLRTAGAETSGPTS